MTKARQIEVGNYHHVYSRGVDGCEIFKEIADYLKFQSLLERLNTTEKARIDCPNRESKGERIIDIFCYCLMPNHFHFIIQEIVEGGMSLFFQKVLSPYVNYFNKKYKRTGSLFGSRFKDKLIDTDQYFKHLVGYIWNNPIKLIKPEYNSVDLFNGNISLSEKEKDFANNYPYKKFPETYFGPEDKSARKVNFDIFDF